MINPYDFYITEEEFIEAENRGISRWTLTKRIRDLGWGKEKAISTPVRKYRTYSQATMKKVKKNNIPPHIFYTRVRMGWNIERASTEPVNSNKDRVQKMKQKNRKYSSEILNKAEENGIRYATFIKRVNSGWDMDLAATTPTLSNEEVLIIARAKSAFSNGVDNFWKILRNKRMKGAQVK